MVERLNEFIADKTNVGKEFSAAGKKFVVAKAEDFEYTDPVDSSVTDKQVLIVRYLLNHLQYSVSTCLKLLSDKSLLVVEYYGAQFFKVFIITVRRYASAVYAVVMCLSVCVCVRVCVCVCLSHSGIVSKQLNV